MDRRRSAFAATAALALAALVVAGCAAEPREPAPSSTSPGPSTSRSPTRATSSSPSASSSPSTSPSPTATAAPADDIALPAACEDIYSATMLASLIDRAPPLNDPGLTMHSTQSAELLEILTSGIPTLRCSWGRPSEFGLATNVSIVDAGQAAAILASLQATGFGCAEQDGGTICRIEQKTLDLDDNAVTLGETHFVRGNGWVSTAWIDFAPEGYTEDIAQTLWG